MGGFMNEKAKTIETKQSVKEQMVNIMKQQEQLNLVAQGILFGVCAEKGLDPREYMFNNQWNLQERPKNGQPEDSAN